MFKYFLKSSKLLKRLKTLGRYYDCCNFTSEVGIESNKLLLQQHNSHFIRLYCCGDNKEKTMIDVGANCNNTSSLSSVIKHWKKRFEDEGIIEPVQSIENIIAHLLGIDKVGNLLNLNDRVLNKQELATLEELCVCRLTRMPVQYIVGEWDFRDVKLKLEPPIFIPRPETESLVDLVSDKIKSNSVSILEIGCGSGAISLSLLHSNKRVNNIVAIDANPHACKLTKKNAQSLKLDDRLYIINASLKKDGKIEAKGGGGSSVTNFVVNLTKDKFDIIVSNPPYIPTKTLFKLQPEVILYEDVKALDGGEDGLELIKPIILYASGALNDGGSLLMEVDSEHPKKIESLVAECYVNKLKFIRTIKDFSNRDRFVEIERIK